MILFTWRVAAVVVVWAVVLTAWTLATSFLTCSPCVVNTGILTLVASPWGTDVDVGVTAGTDVDGVRTMWATVTGFTRLPPIEEETDPVRPIMGEGRTAGYNDYNQNILNTLVADSWMNVLWKVVCGLEWQPEYPDVNDQV